MSYGRYLRELLAPLRLYDLEAPFNGGELNVQGGALDGVDTWLAELRRESTLAEAESWGLERIIALLARRPVADTPTGMRKALENGDLEGVAGRLGNVFEEVLPPECGAVFAIRDALLAAGALGAGMSGSGPTVFGIFREEGLARAAQEKTLLLGESYAVGPLGKLT